MLGVDFSDRNRRNPGTMLPLPRNQIRPCSNGTITAKPPPRAIPTGTVLTHLLTHWHRWQKSKPCARPSLVLLQYSTSCTEQDSALHSPTCTQRFHSFSVVLIRQNRYQQSHQSDANLCSDSAADTPSNGGSPGLRYWQWRTQQACFHVTTASCQLSARS